MATIEDDYKRLVNIKKVVKAVKNVGEFALWRSSQDSTLLMTQHFILNLNEEQAWEAQCALLVKEIGIWFSIYKGDLIEKRPIENWEYQAYYDMINGPVPNIIGFTELYLGNIALYAADGGYTGFRRDYIEMINSLPTIKQRSVSSPAIVSDYHVVNPCKIDDCEYLAKLLF